MRPCYVLDLGDGPPTIATTDDLGGAPARLEIGGVHRADGWTATRCRPGILWAAMGLDPGGDGATLAAVYLRLAARGSWDSLAFLLGCAAPCVFLENLLARHRETDYK